MSIPENRDFSAAIWFDPTAYLPRTPHARSREILYQQPAIFRFSL
jgi:hypothetical protein